MGEVFLAVDTLLDNQLVALKIIHEDLCRNEKYTKRFLREIAATRLITSNSVVRTFDAGVERGRPYFSMEYIRGATLAEELDDESFQISLCEGLTIFHQIAKGISAIHKADVIHRDLKPSNIMLTEDGEVKISDFGLARTTTSAITKSGGLAGTASYVAPELIDGSPATPAVDMYALGVIAYEIFTYRMPFTGENDLALIVAPMRQDPTHPSELVPAIPLWLADLILGMLSRTPDARPPIDVALGEIEQKASETAETEASLVVPYVLRTAVRVDEDVENGSFDSFTSGGLSATRKDTEAAPTGTSDPSLSSQSFKVLRAVQTHSSTLLRVVFLTLCLAFAWYIGFSESFQDKRSSPGGVTGLIGWYRVDAVTAADGTHVARVADQSRFDYTATQSFYDAQPRYVKNAIAGYPALRFDGTNDFLQLDGVAQALRSANGVTVIFVARTDTPKRSQYVWSSHLENQEENLIHGGFSPEGGVRIRSIKNPFQRGFHDSRQVQITEFAIVATVAAGREVSAFFNSGKLFTDKIPYDIEFARAGFFSLGQEYDASGPGDFFSGELAEVLIYNRALSERERARIESLLSAKYKISLRR